jgi:hypothetical protein
MEILSFNITPHSPKSLLLKFIRAWHKKAKDFNALKSQYKGLYIIRLEFQAFWHPCVEK